MAGHSKWANIKHRKARQDAKRGKVFTKIIREITVAAKGGPDPADNPRLRLALDKANSENMPKDTITRAIQKGSGTGETGDIEEITFEGYGPGGIAIYIETVTDNRNRTVAEVRHAFSKFGGNLGTDGSVSYLFNKIGSSSSYTNLLLSENISTLSPLDRLGFVVNVIPSNANVNVNVAFFKSQVPNLGLDLRTSGLHAHVHPSHLRVHPARAHSPEVLRSGP